MIAIGAYVLWNGRCGVVRAIVFLREAGFTIATIELNPREIVVVPIDELVPIEEVARAR